MGIMAKRRRLAADDDTTSAINTHITLHDHNEPGTIADGVLPDKIAAKMFSCIFVFLIESLIVRAVLAGLKPEYSQPKDRWPNAHLAD